MKTLFSRTLAAPLLAAGLSLGLAACGDAPSDAPAPVASAPALIPAPAMLQAGEGQFVLHRGLKLHADGDAARTVAGQFGALLARSNGLDLALEEGDPGNTGIAFVLEPGDGAAEAYALEVTPSRVEVKAGDARGLFYGAMTLWQLASGQGDGSVAIPALRIEDAPRFSWRGFMLDSARHFQSVDEIKQLLDAMAQHKLNTFHWHLTDDQGWRIEIKRYPKLTQVGGCRIPAGDGGRDPVSGQPRDYCGYYTQAQIRDVVAYAAARHIAVVPEINVPGHSTAAIAAYPELGVLDTPLQPLPEWGVFPNLLNAEESTFEFVENVLAEVVELFPGRYVHVGGDEAVKDQWIASARVQQRMRELGAKDEAEMQSHLIKRLERFLAGHDRRLIGWDEILEGGLPPEATVMSWRGTDGGLKAAGEGHDVVMAPSSELYLDYLQTASRNEPPGRPATIPLQQVYAFEPVPAQLDPAYHHHILGLQANAWTEHMRSFARVQHAFFPRIAAVAETGWSPAARKDYADFLQRLPVQLQRYRALGIAWAQTPFQAEYDVAPTADGVQVTLSNPLGYDIRYSTDGSAPTAASPLYREPLQLPLPAQLHAAVFAEGRALAEPTALALDAPSLRNRDNAALQMCSSGLMLRLEDDGPADGERAIFNVDIFNPCWLWEAAALDGIDRIRVRAGQIPYYFQLAHDEPARRFVPARSAHGELEILAGCDGPLLAQVPLPATAGPDGFIELDADIPAQASPRDLCVRFTGDTRPTMWVVDRMTLVPAGTH
ncbi:family 20 glycosylhydrolase [Flavobacterium sp. MXW15]|uniref:beta-N-acetylhexosaminidase n=1 Tax=Xanthomonas chitinilytica TaxID=2989819 RepID=A0ABT3JT11_9XANT|nr:family 20 glycosylhydrolase [Xanthomonas sp. H13-6]MCW4455585.1 family 20 glycosylhydrolase [Flavobacterium sp. MXW15]MCW4471609.1 family 20 glycosylhydrolase [Xanthomonas sp. H13-6]